METFKVKEQTRLSITIGEKVYEVTRPKIKDQKILQASLKNADGKELDIITAYLVGMGFDEDAIVNLDGEQMLSLVEHMNATKKK